MRADPLLSSSSATAPSSTDGEEDVDVEVVTYATLKREARETTGALSRMRDGNDGDDHDGDARYHANMLPCAKNEDVDSYELFSGWTKKPEQLKQFTIPKDIALGLTAPSPRRI